MAQALLPRPCGPGPMAQNDGSTDGETDGHMDRQISPAFYTVEFTGHRPSEAAALPTIYKSVLIHFEAQGSYE